MKQRSINESKQEEQLQPGSLNQQHRELGMEFHSPEDAIRFDAERTAVPPGLRERVMREIEGERVRLPWWKRWFR